MKSFESTQFLIIAPFLRTALILALLLTAVGCVPNQPPRAGKRQYEASNFLSFPNGVEVNLAGGNLHVNVTDLSIDTRIGEWRLDRVYNSAGGAWMHNFEMSYDGDTLIDATGAVIDTTGTGANARVPGTVWVKLDANRIKTVGGLVHEFSGGVLSKVYRGDLVYPQLRFIAGPDGVADIDQCTSAASCEDVYDIAYVGGRVDAITDRAGREARFSYDAAGRLATARDGLDMNEGWPGFRYLYVDGLLFSVQNSEGETLTVQYSDKTKVIDLTRVGEGSPKTLFAYGAPQGRFRTIVTNPLGDDWDFFFDGSRRLLESRLPTGEGSTVTWTTQGDPFRIASAVDAAGNTTTWNYPSDDVVLVTTPTQNLISIAFSAYGSHHVNQGRPDARPVVSIGDLAGVAVTNAYYSATQAAPGLLEWTENGAGERTSFSYDSLGQLASTMRPDGLVASFSNYQPSGHARQVVMGGETDDRSYDLVGNELSSWDMSNPTRPGRPGIVARSFDADRNLETLTVDQITQSPPTLTDTVVFERRSDGQLLAIRRPYGGDHVFRYDALGQMTERDETVDGQAQTTTIGFDLAGRPNSMEQSNGMREERDYDESGRVLELRHLRVGGPVEQRVTYVYANGRLVRKDDDAYVGPETIAYDGQGQIDVVTFPGGERTEYGYDVRGRVIAREYFAPAGAIPLRTIGLGYDAAGRRTRIDDDGTTVLDRTFVGGKLSQEAYGNGSIRTYEYDPTGLREPAKTRTVKQGGQETEETLIQHVRTLLLHVYADAFYDGVTHPADWQEVYTLGFPVGGSRIFSAETKSSGEPAVVDYFQDDFVGNHWSTGSTAVFNPERNRLDSHDGVVYGYDDAGFVTQRGSETLDWTANGRIASLGGGSAFVWDAEQRLVQVLFGANCQVARFGGDVQGGVAAAFESLSVGPVKIDLVDGSRLYRHYDMRGNVQFVSDDDADIVQRHHYGPYGVKETIGSADDDRTFAQGQDIDGELVVLGARVYDSKAFRFLSPDPILQPLNQYAYSEGDPIHLWDPDGRFGALSGFNSGAAGFDGPAGFGDAFVAAGLAALGTAAKGAAKGALVGAAFPPGAGFPGAIGGALGGALLEVFEAARAEREANGGNGNGSGLDAFENMGVAGPPVGGFDEGAPGGPEDAFPDPGDGFDSGCSPTELAGGIPRRETRHLGGFLLLQVLLGVALLMRRRE